MLNQRWWKAIGVGIPAITGLVLLGVSKAFDVTITTNLFNTGITPAMVLGIGNLIIAFAVYRNRV